MTTEELLEEIEKLPLSKHIYIVERSLQLLQKRKEEEQLLQASEELYQDYCSDEDLTSFTALDSERFYEAK